MLVVGRNERDAGQRRLRDSLIVLSFSVYVAAAESHNAHRAPAFAFPRRDIERSLKYEGVRAHDTPPPPPPPPPPPLSTSARFPLLGRRAHGQQWHSIFGDSFIFYHDTIQSSIFIFFIDAEHSFLCNHLVSFILETFLDPTHDSLILSVVATTTSFLAFEWSHKIFNSRK